MIFCLVLQLNNRFTQTVDFSSSNILTTRWLGLETEKTLQTRYEIGSSPHVCVIIEIKYVAYAIIRMDTGIPPSGFSFCILDLGS